MANASQVEIPLEDTLKKTIHLHGLNTTLMRLLDPYTETLREVRRLIFAIIRAVYERNSKPKHGAN